MGLCLAVPAESPEPRSEAQVVLRRQAQAKLQAAQDETTELSANR
jgi:hypothetical protein